MAKVSDSKDALNNFLPDLATFIPPRLLKTQLGRLLQNDARQLNQTHQLLVDATAVVGRLDRPLCWQTDTNRVQLVANLCAGLRNGRAHIHGLFADAAELLEQLATGGCQVLVVRAAPKLYFV
jgi:hypothetical protein